MAQQPQPKPAPPQCPPPAHLLKRPKKRLQFIPPWEWVKAEPAAEAVIPPRRKAARAATALSSELRVKAEPAALSSELLREAVEAETAAEAECLAEAEHARAEGQFLMECLNALYEEAKEGTLGRDELMVRVEHWCDHAGLAVAHRLCNMCRLNRRAEEARWWREEQAANNQGIVSTNAYQFEEDTYKETSKNGDQVKIETTDQATIDGLDASQWTEKGAFEGARKELEGVDIDIDIDIVDIHRREELDGTRCG